MLTTTLAQSKSLVLDMPSNEKPEPPQAYPEEATITLLPTDNHKIAYYNGGLKNEEQIKTCSISETRKLLQAKQQEVTQLPASFSKHAHQIHVLIKPANDSKYADLINLLDEMMILKIDYCTIVDITTQETTILEKIKK